MIHQQKRVNVNTNPGFMHLPLPGAETISEQEFIISHLEAHLDENRQRAFK
jgi:hypothetical protein